MATRGSVVEAAKAGRHLLHVFPSFGIGGVPLRMARIINHLGPRYRHSILALDQVATASDRFAPQAVVDIVPFAVDKRRPLSNLLRFHHVLRAQRPDLLVTYNWGAIEWAMVNRLLPVCRHVHHEAGFGLEEAERQIPRRVLYRRLALGRALQIVVPSRRLQDIALTVWRLPSERVLLIPNGIDVARFSTTRPDVKSPQFIRRDGELILGTVAPLRPEKNLARLIRVFALVAPTVDARLVIAGEGSERAPLERLVGELGLAERVVFLGNVSRPELLLQEFDVFAISSETEQMPNSVLEAMAAGLPVAGVDVGDIMQMVAAENREFIVDKANEPAFARGLTELFRRPDKRRELSRENRRTVEMRFSQEAMFSAYDKVFSL